MLLLSNYCNIRYCNNRWCNFLLLMRKGVFRIEIARRQGVVISNLCESGGVHVHIYVRLLFVIVKNRIQTLTEPCRI